MLSYSKKHVYILFVQIWKFQHDDIKIESCKHYRYLDGDTNREGRNSQEIKCRIYQGRKVVEILNSV